MDEAPPQAQQVRRRLRVKLAAVPLVVWLLSGLWGSLLLGASVVWPVTYGYDEVQHVDMAYDYSSQPFHFYAPGRLAMTKAAEGILSTTPGHPQTESFADAPALPRRQRPTLGQLGGHGFVPGTINQMEQHPPLYYWLEAVVLRVPGVSHLAWDLQVWLMRLVSIAMLLPLPLLCWATARRLLGAETRRAPRSRSPDDLAVFAAVLPLSVPNLIRDGSSVTNDALLILSTSVLLYLLSRVVTGDLSTRTAGGVGAALVIALLTKGFALVLPPVILAAYLVGVRRERVRLRSLLAPLAVVAAGAVVGGLWWLRNLIAYGAVQVDGFGPNGGRILYGPPSNSGTLTAFVPKFIHDFSNRIWGGIGLPDLPYPGRPIIYGWLIFVVLGIVAAFLLGPRVTRSRAAVLSAATVLTIAVVGYGSYKAFVHWPGPTHGTQGRYIYQTFVVLFALAAIGWLRLLRPRLTLLLVPVVLVASLATNAYVWSLVVRSWYTPSVPAPAPLRAVSRALRHWGSPVAPPAAGGLRGAVTALVRWSPLPEGLTLLFVLLPVAAGLAALAVCIRHTRIAVSSQRGIGVTRDDEESAGGARPSATRAGARR